MTAFAAAIDALFADPNLAVDALYWADGADPGIPVRVIARRPDRIGEFDETRILTKTTMFDIRASEIAAPAEGDTIVWTAAPTSSRASRCETASGWSGPSSRDHCETGSGAAGQPRGDHGG